MKLKRNTWYKNNDYHMTYEEHDGLVFIHLVIDKFSKDVLADIKNKWKDFKAKLYYLGHEYVFTYTKDMRIVNMVEKGEVIGHKDNYKVVVWALKSS